MYFANQVEHILLHNSLTSDFMSSYHRAAFYWFHTVYFVEVEDIEKMIHIRQTN